MDDRLERFRAAVIDYLETLRAMAMAEWGRAMHLAPVGYYTGAANTLLDAIEAIKKLEVPEC